MQFKKNLSHKRLCKIIFLDKKAKNPKISHPQGYNDLLLLESEIENSNGKKEFQTLVFYKHEPHKNKPYYLKKVWIKWKLPITGMGILMRETLLPVWLSKDQIEDQMIFSAISKNTRDFYGKHRNQNYCGAI